MSKKLFKPISDIPQWVYNSLWGGLDGGELEVRFWYNDDEFGLHLTLSNEQIEVIQRYGVTDDLLHWMSDEEMFTVESVVDITGDVDEVEVYAITDEVIARYIEECEVKE